MKDFSKLFVGKVLFFLATGLMLVSCGGAGNQLTKPNAKVVYVCADGKSGANGSSWETCSLEIQSAIKQAQDSNKEVWFKAGEYILSKTITLDKDTKLYGGFKGTENELKDRKLDTNATILSGDRKLRVLKTTNLSENSVLDGFVITQAILLDNQDGAGMHNTNSHITISNVSFSENVAGNFGGAMYNKYSNPRLTNVSFVKNNSIGGGAMYNDESSPTIINASFSKNTAIAFGAVYNYKVNPKFINVTFSENTADESGAVCNDTSGAIFINATFTKNKSTTVGDAMSNVASNPIIKNSIFWANGTDEIYNESSSTPAISNSVVKNAGLTQAPYKDKNNQAADPLLSKAKTKTINGVTHTYYELGSNSPAINKGDNHANTQTTDQIGNPRKNGTIDIGAVEK